MDTTSFIQDLALILMAVGFVSALFTHLKWPRVIGYIVAGTLIGRHTFGGSFVVNESSIEVLGQIGVLFLMFTLGLEFSVRKLKKVGHVIFPTAILDMAVMVWAGHFVGTRFLGWGSVQSLFLGAAISDSATTLLAKTINEMGWGTRRFTKYIFGITITEDILCVGLIALLTGIVQSGSVQMGAVFKSLGGLLLFLIGVSIFGLLLIPRLLNRVAELKDDESLLLTILGVCFLVAFMAAKLEFNLALGAFLVGVMGAESAPVKRIYQQCAPLRIMFSAIFFVTIGLLIDPHEMLVNWRAILGVTGIVIAFKTINCTVGSLLTGQDLKNSLQTGIGLAQIGEFAYLVALIGVTMGAADSNMYQIAVGVSVLTTILNPFLLRASEPLSEWIVRSIPAGWRSGLETYMHWVQRFLHSQEPRVRNKDARYHLTLMVLQMVLVAAVFIAAGLLEQFDFSKIMPWMERSKKLILWGGACLITIPNAIFVLYRARNLGCAVSDVLVPDKLEKTRWGESFRSVNRLFFAVLGGTLLFVEVVLLSGSIMPDQVWERILVSLTLVVVGALGWNEFRKMGKRSLRTLRGVLNKEVEVNPAESTAELLDIHTEEIMVARRSDVCGKSLREINLRVSVGVSVVGIQRSGDMLVNPSGTATLEAGDVVLVLGDDKQIDLAKRLLL